MAAKITVELSPVAIDGMCWAWTGCLNSRGYGCWSHNGRVKLTHRVAYELLVGPIGDGLQIDHLCTNKRCCNPAHLEPVTGQVNSSRSDHAVKTLCVHGHRLSGNNLIVKQRPNGRTIRNCRECTNARRRVTKTTP